MSDVKGLIERLRGDIFDAVPDDNDMQNVLSVAADALEAEHAKVERLRAEADANWPCDGWCNVNDGPDEMCSRHGRRVSEVWQMAHDAMQRAERTEEQLQAIREWAQGLISSDDMTRWGDHCPNMHGRQALAILDITDGATDE